MLRVCKGAALIISSKFDFSVLKVGARPFLMKELVHVFSFLFPLNVLNESQHAVLFVSLREDFGDQ